MFDHLCTETECRCQAKGSMLTSGENGQAITAFRYLGKDWRDWMHTEDAKVRLIDTNTGDSSFVEADLVYCVGAIDAALSHIAFNAVEATINDVTLYLNVDLGIVFVWKNG